MAVGIGIDVGLTSVQGVVLERAGARLTLAAAHEVPCDTSDPEVLGRALSDLRTTLRIHSPVVLGVPSAAVLLSTVTPLIVNPRRCHLAIQFELQQQLPFSLAEAAWHYRWLFSNGHALEGRSGFRAPGSGQRSRSQSPQPRTPSPQRCSEVVVVAMRRALLDQRLACCRRAGLCVGAVAANPLAALNVWSAGERGGPGTVALLSFLSEQAAEWIVRTAQDLQVVPVLSPSPETFWDELSSSWSALRDQLPGVPEAIWSFGAPDLVTRAQDRLGTAFGTPIERLTPARLVAAGWVSPQRGEPSIAALGLALQSVGLARLPVNLLAGRQLQERAQRSQRTAAVIGGILLAATLGLGLSGMLEMRRRHARLLEALERRERVYGTFRPEVRALLQQQQRLERRSRQLQRLAVGSTLLVRAMAQVAETLPDGVWLTQADYARNTDGVEGLLEGRAKSFQQVAQFIEQLKSAAGMTTVKLLSNPVVKDEATGKELIAFTMQLQRPAEPE